MAHFHACGGHAHCNAHLCMRVCARALPWLISLSGLPSSFSVLFCPTFYGSLARMAEAVQWAALAPKPRHMLSATDNHATDADNAGEDNETAEGTSMIFVRVCTELLFGNGELADACMPSGIVDPVYRRQQEELMRVYSCHFCILGAHSLMSSHLLLNATGSMRS